MPLQLFDEVDRNFFCSLRSTSWGLDHRSAAWSGPLSFYQAWYETLVFSQLRHEPRLSWPFVQQHGPDRRHLLSNGQWFESNTYAILG
jgi:hypothetical protein